MKKLHCSFKFIVFMILIGVSILYTVLIKTVDVKNIGPYFTEVGFANLNSIVAKAVGHNETLYTVTDYVSYLAFAIIGIFFLIGLFQMIKRKSLFKVDNNILSLGVTYVITGIIFIMFELIKLNYRTILIDGKLEASYPSSTTLMSLVVFISLIFQIMIYIKNDILKISLSFISLALAIFLVIGRIYSGVHWISDIIGGVIMSITMLCGYFYFKALLDNIGLFNISK